MTSRRLLIRVVVVALAAAGVTAAGLSLLVAWLIVAEPVALASALHTRDIRPVLRVLAR